jgi:hypothetical protein
LIVRGHELILGQVERRGQGILETPFLAAAVVRLVIDLACPEGLAARYPEPGRDDRVSLEGVGLPLLRLRPEAAMADLASMVLQLFHSRRKSL